jgi:hypothetical protein
MPDSKRSGALKDETTGTILSSGDERQSLDPGMRRITARKSSIARCDETFLTDVSSDGRNALRNLFQVQRRDALSLPPVAHPPARLSLSPPAWRALSS